MDAGKAIDVARQAVMLMLVLGLPILLTGFLVGLVVSILQAATQIQDQTLSFVPKIIAMLLAAVVVGPWILSRLVEFGREMFSAGP